MKKYNINTERISEDLQNILDDILEPVNEFAQQCEPFEDKLFLHVDSMTKAIYCECHLSAKKLLSFGTIDVPLDPEEQPEYRANREIVEDHIAFDQMKDDAKQYRTFSNIVAEFDTQINPESPIKIIGGQHRYIAIKEAFEIGINEWHGIKVYFGLDKDQRLDVQLISNINIAASTDLYDRLQETSRGPELRDWCQDVGFLDSGQDFSSKRQRGSAITVREVRSFLVNYCKGKLCNIKDFDDLDTTPIICKTGKPDHDWEELRNSNVDIWTDISLKESAREFVLLDEAQRKSIENKKGKISPHYAEKALNFAILTAWAFVAGLLQQNKTRLKRHHNLSNSKSNKDPLNAEAMAKARHKSDPENYRGLGTRYDAKERGRCVEMFYIQAEKDTGITSKILDIAIKRYHKKQANIELLEAERKI